LSSHSLVHNAPMPDRPQYCGHCGSALAGTGQSRDPSERTFGPALLVLVALFARDRLLLLRRGTEPYKNRWAPPGGFVEHGESLEAAAVREVWEEVRISINETQLMPCAVISLPALNQVHHGFVVRLPDTVEAHAEAPEALEAGWFTEQEVRGMDNWAPAANVDIGVQFQFFRSSTFEFIQQGERFLRIIRADEVTYLSGCPVT